MKGSNSRLMPCNPTTSSYNIENANSMLMLTFSYGRQCGMPWSNRPVWSGVSVALPGRISVDLDKPPPDHITHTPRGDSHQAQDLPESQLALATCALKMPARAPSFRRRTARAALLLLREHPHRQPGCTANGTTPHGPSKLPPLTCPTSGRKQVAGITNAQDKK